MYREKMKRRCLKTSKQSDRGELRLVLGIEVMRFGRVPVIEKYTFIIACT